MDRYKRMIEPAKGDEDWAQAREVFVKAFHDYSLYAYMEPDELKRPEFLRRYMEANYDVTVRQGKGFLLVMRISETIEQERRETDINRAPPPGKIVGALLFVAPAEDGIGWAVKDDAPYWDAYDRFKLAEVSDGCLRRVKEYEAWEHENVTQKLWQARVPLWNGLFCALDPEYCPKGCGTLSYEKTIRLMCSKHAARSGHATQRQSGTQPSSNCDANHNRFHSNENRQLCPSSPTDFGFFTRLWKGLVGESDFISQETNQGTNDSNVTPNNEDEASGQSMGMRVLHGLAMLHHRPIPGPGTFQTHPNKSSASKQRGQSLAQTPMKYGVKSETREAQAFAISAPRSRGIPIVHSITDDHSGEKNVQFPRETDIALPHTVLEQADMFGPDNTPLIAAISHSAFAAHFHEKNGFHQVANIPYRRGHNSSNCPFNVHVLFMDPFNTGKIEKLGNAMVGSKPTVKSSEEGVTGGILPPVVAKKLANEELRCAT